MLATRTPNTVDARRAHVESEPVATAWACLSAVRDGDLRFALEFTKGISRDQLADLRRRLPDTDAWGVTSAARPLSPGEEEVVMIADVDERYPVDDDFLAALDFMPEASGVALGFDRLVMLATAAQRIEAVLWAPVAE